MCRCRSVIIAVEHTRSARGPGLAELQSERNSITRRRGGRVEGMRFSLLHEALHALQDRDDSAEQGVHPSVEQRCL